MVTARHIMQKFRYELLNKISMVTARHIMQTFRHELLNKISMVTTRHTNLLELAVEPFLSLESLQRKPFVRFRILTSDRQLLQKIN
jgi:hypothetical protein